MVLLYGVDHWTERDFLGGIADYAIAVPPMFMVLLTAGAAVIQKCCKGEKRLGAILLDEAEKEKQRLDEAEKEKRRSEKSTLSQRSEKLLSEKLDDMLTAIENKKELSAGVQRKLKAFASLLENIEHDFVSGGNPYLLKEFCNHSACSGSLN